MNEERLDAALAPYVPTRLLARLGPGRDSARFSAAVVMADVTGFTALSERLITELGRLGADELERTVNPVHARVVDTALRYGGDVARFAGDAAILVFPCEDDEAAALRRATLCALELVDGPSDALSLHVAISLGDCQLLAFEESEGAQFVLVGEALTSLGAPLRAAGPREVYASPAVVTALRAAGAVLDGARVLGLQSIPADSWGGADYSFSRWRAFVPPAVLDHVAHGVERWLSELRQVSVVFLTLPNDDDAGALGRRDPATVVRQMAAAFGPAVRANYGWVDKYLADDKGISALAVFGLPPLAPHYRPVNALNCAFRVARAMSGERSASGIGVATGRVYCGPLGGERRREYSVLGTAVNRAARLAALGGLGWDDATQAAATWRGAARTATALKGIDGPVGVWHGAADGALGGGAATPQPHFGRQRELGRCLDALFGDDRSQAVLVQGEAGLGKTSFLGAVVAKAREGGWWVFEGRADALRLETPWHAWRELLRQLLGRSLRDLAALLDGEPDRLALLPLVGPVLGVAAEETDATRALVGAVRLDNTRSLICDLIERRAATMKRRLLIVIDDAHWLDSSSAGLLHHLRLQGATGAILVGTRPHAFVAGSDWQRFVEDPALTTIALAGLDPGEIAAVAAEQVGARSLGPRLVQFLVERAQGNPFYAQEIASALLGAAQTETREDGSLELCDDDRLGGFDLPGTVEATVRLRIDQLATDERVTLKRASALGQQFSVELLSAVMGSPTSTMLQAHLRTLSAAALLLSSTQGQLAFRHRFTQEVAYEAMTGEQRREVHEVAGSYYEETAEGGVEAVLPELAYHFERTDDLTRCLKYLEAAGTSALRGGANLEASRFFERALARAERSRQALGTTQPLLRTATWKRQLGDALFGLGAIERVAEVTRAALAELAVQLPSSGLGWAARAARESGRLLWHWLTPRRLRLAPLASQAELLEGARAASRLAEAYYFINDPIAMYACAGTAVGLANRISDASPLATAYGMLGLVLGTSRLSSAAHRHLEHARQLASKAGDHHQASVAWFYTGMLDACFGRWAAAESAAQLGLSEATRINAYLEEGFLRTLIATNALYTANFSVTAKEQEIVHSVALQNGNVQQEGWSCNVLAVSALLRGRFDEASQRTTRSRAIFLRNQDTLSLIIAEGVAAVTCLHRADWSESERLGRSTLERIESVMPTSWGALEGYAAPVEVFTTLALRSSPGTSPWRSAYAGAIRTALKHLGRYALFFPFAGCRYLLWDGLLDALSSRHRSARRKVSKAITVAKRYSMPFEEARSRRVFGALRGDDDDDVTRARELERLHGLAEPSGPIWDGSVLSTTGYRKSLW